MAAWQPRTGGQQRPPDKSGRRGAKFYDAGRILQALDYVLDNIFVTFGEKMYQQRLGVPMGFACSPMFAVLLLAFYELSFVRKWGGRIRDAVESAPVQTPWGVMPWSAARTRMARLVGDTARSCRAIDDVLLIGLTATERQWILCDMYPPSLELKEVYASPGRICYLDMEILTDRGGFYTTHFDKRDEFEVQGAMASVRKWPHIESAISEQTKYNCLYGFMVSASKRVMRRKILVRLTADRIVEMRKDGYKIKVMRHHLAKFAKRRFRFKKAGRYMMNAVWRRVGRNIDEAVDGRAERRVGRRVDEAEGRANRLAARRLEASMTSAAKSPVRMEREEKERPATLPVSDEQSRRRQSSRDGVGVQALRMEEMVDEEEREEEEEKEEEEEMEDGAKEPATKGPQGDLSNNELVVHLAQAPEEVDVPASRLRGIVTAFGEQLREAVQLAQSDDEWLDDEEAATSLASLCV